METRFPLMPKYQSRKIRVAIRRVFVEVWDPIGIKDEPNAQDEYDSYIGRTYELLVTGETDRAIEAYLLQIVESMGMDGSKHSHQYVIDALRAIDLKHDPETKTPTESTGLA